MKTRKTLMGLPPAPHLRANAKERESAEARKQRVLSRIAALDASSRGKASAPRPASSRPPPTGATSGTGPPPPGPSASVAPKESTTAKPPPVEAEAAPQVNLSGTQIIPPKGGSVTTLMAPMTPNIPLTLPNTPPEAEGPTPVVASPPVDFETKTDLMERPPTTERMLRAATPAESVAPTSALAIRPWEAPVPAPPMTGPLDPRLILVNEPHSPRAASFRLLRDSLVAKRMPRVVAVSSPVPKDGKTTCAINLAMALSEQTANRVLLLDGNLFEPELGDIFMMARMPSVTPATAVSWLAPYKIIEARPTLHVAGIPRTPGEPLPRIDQPRFEALIDRLVRVSYDYVIIDAPALRGSPAVAQLLATVDGTLLAVRSGGTTTRDLRRAVDQIPKHKALGIALVDAMPHA
jgi:Mrp family chromosome partitioning ATPase